MGRLIGKFARAFYSGYDISGYARNLGTFGAEAEFADLTVLTDAAHGGLPGPANIQAGPFNGVLDNTATSGLHALASGANNTEKLITYALGDGAVPAQGDPTFSLEAVQLDYKPLIDAGAMVINLRWTGKKVTAASLQDWQPFGVLLNANVARTAVNAAVGVDNPTAGQTLFGGQMIYHITAGGGTGTVLVKVQDAAINADGSFADLTGATSGAIADTAIPASGVVALARTATVRQFLRWQITLTGMTSAAFVLCFNRSYF